MRRLIFCGDAACESGFAKATHAYLEALRTRFEIDVVALNYRGTPNDYQSLYRLWPAAVGGDRMGINLVNHLIDRIGPDVCLIQNDPWNFPHYLMRIHAIPVVGIVAVDGKNCRGAGLNGLRHAIFWTQFGLHEARAGGYTGPASVIPLGVDRTIYQPRDRAEARRLLRLRSDRINDDAFIVGAVGRNQPRKRLDLTIMYFAEWVRTRQIDDAFLYLHVAPTGDQGYDCEQLAAYYGVASRLVICEPSVWRGSTEERLAITYNACDVLATTTQGEGWGLPVLESMACGVPVIVPTWSALGEWPGDAAIQIPCTTLAATLNHVNVIGGIADRELFIEALDRLYRDRAWRDEMGRRALRHASQPAYQWTAIGEALA